jgi:4a-hydroxytetrahydrobiopterin dehydratase
VRRVPRGRTIVTAAEIAELHRQVADWDIVELDGIKPLRRVFSVDDFAQALEFTRKVGELAVEEGHHPALLTEWGRTTVTWWTHKIKGLHRNDFIMAAKTNELYQPSAKPWVGVRVGVDPISLTS